jgi:hypothetical protein
MDVFNLMDIFKELGIGKKMEECECEAQDIAAEAHDMAITVQALTVASRIVELHGAAGMAIDDVFEVAKRVMAMAFGEEIVELEEAE